MKLTVKTLKGGKFTVEVEPSNTVAEAKGIIVSVRDSRLIRCDDVCAVCGNDRWSYWPKMNERWYAWPRLDHAVLNRFDA